MNPAACALFLVSTFILAGALQVFWLATRFSHRFRTPLDFGLTFRGKRVFGENKMVRGLIVMIPACGIIFGLAALAINMTVHSPAEIGLWPLSPLSYAALGLWAGLGFMMGELPNSFLKRQLGVPSGKPPAGATMKLFSFVIDQCDSVAGMLLAVSLVVEVHWKTALYVLASGLALHWFFTVVLFQLGGKERPA